VATPITRDTIVDALVNRLRADILSGRYPPGSYLPPERELAAGYEVTRTSLKHAIVRLAQAGLVETKHGVGTRVRDYERLGGPELLPMLIAKAGPEWVEEIFEVRREIGVLVAARAAVHAAPEHRERLRGLVAEVAGAGDAAAAQLADCEVHRVLAAAAGNRVYGLLVNALLNAYMEVRELLQAPFADPRLAAERLAPVVEAVRAGEPDRAGAAAEAYLAETERLMLEGLR
jgi:GntR family transcriptional repressor for pyruvate dehydrogenase complex